MYYFTSKIVNTSPCGCYSIVRGISPCFEKLIRIVLIYHNIMAMDLVYISHHFL